ncbi:DUF4242 domain-containing protein [bacterium]|nr:DUF4242 domain-containing protein [bacterium]
MPLYMDIHRNAAGITKEGLQAAHAKDLAVQGKHGVNHINYWYSEKDQAIFCLCEAPSKEAAAAVHREAHGGMADDIIEVQEGV